MTIDPDAAYQALLARDSRFDGHLFVGVTSTGIYCRPICRVRTPLRKNCRFFASHAQAEAAAFRPCLKCRPELAPGRGLAWSVMDASQTLARQAAQAIDAAAASGESQSVAALAARLGVSDRHLRRIFFAEHGVTPLQHLQTRRLLLAKHLLTDTQLPVTQVALSSGFKSLRRFNAAFAGSYRMSPSRLRRTSTDPGDGAADDADAGISVLLGYRQPLDSAALRGFIELRAIDGIEWVEARSIRRSVRAGTLGTGPGWIEATLLGSAPLVRVRFASSLGAARVVAATRRWLDLDAAPSTIDAALAELPGAPGLRLPGAFDAFELAVRAVLGQQVSIAAARTLARRVVERFGTHVETPWPGVDRAFPAPAVIAATTLERIAELGIIRSRAAAIIGIASGWGELEPLLVAGAAPAPLIDRLCEIRGVGRWTAHYVAMRALGWPDAFPPGDVAAQKAMQLCFGTESARGAEIHAARWQPWRSYAMLRLWNSLEKTA